MRTATSNALTAAVKLSPFSTATAAFSLAKGGGIFLRRALIAAAFSSENGGCCGFLSASERYSARRGSFAFSHVTSPPSIFPHINSAVCLGFPLPKTTVQIIDPNLCWSTPFSHVNFPQKRLRKWPRIAYVKKNFQVQVLPLSSLSGWSDAQVMKLTRRQPKLIFANVETVLKPRMRSLQDMGFSDTEIFQLVSSCPSLFSFRDIQPRINFWRSLLGSNERFLKACSRNMFLLTSSLAQNIEPSISLLREHGISEERIAHMVVTMPGYFGRIDKLKEGIKYIEELGVARDSRVYTYALHVVINVSRSKFDATLVTLMSFGWSQPDIIALFRKCPSIWKLSKKNICDKMTFLMKEAGCELTCISSYPKLLKYSLEKRLRPGYEVLNFLNQNKLLDRERKLPSVMLPTEEKFRKKFLFLLRKEKFIAQYDSYVVAVQGKHHVVAEN